MQDDLIIDYLKDFHKNDDIDFIKIVSISYNGINAIVNYYLYEYQETTQQTEISIFSLLNFIYSNKK